MAQFDFAASIFGGQDATLARMVYIPVGASAMYKLVQFSRGLSRGEVIAEGGRRL